MKSFKEFMAEQTETIDEAKVPNPQGPYLKAFNDFKKDDPTNKAVPYVKQMLGAMSDGMDEQEAYDKHWKKFATAAGKVQKILKKQGISVTGPS